VARDGPLPERLLVSTRRRISTFLEAVLISKPAAVASFPDEMGPAERHLPGTDPQFKSRWVLGHAHDGEHEDDDDEPADDESGDSAAYEVPSICG
jgi:hypothetical protein